MVNRLTGEVPDGFNRQWRAADGVGRVDLVLAHAGDIDDRIPGNGQARHALTLGIHANQHYRVGALFGTIRVGIGAHDQNILRFIVGKGDIQLLPGFVNDFSVDADLAELMIDEDEAGDADAEDYHQKR